MKSNIFITVCWTVGFMFAAVAIAAETTHPIPILPDPDISSANRIKLEDQWTEHLRNKYDALTEKPSNETQWCEFLKNKYESVTEYVLFDGSRVDYLNREYAIEADWAKGLKIYEAVGQAKYYARITHKKPAILLLVKEKDEASKKSIYKCFIASGDIRIFIEYIEDYK